MMDAWLLVGLLLIFASLALGAGLTMLVLWARSLNRSNQRKLKAAIVSMAQVAQSLTLYRESKREARSR